MAMQTDVTSAHLNGSGFAYIGRTRLKSVVISGQASAGTVDIFDTATAPIAATYGQAGTTITVTKEGHGLTTGTIVGIAFIAAGGVSATDGNYPINVLGPDTFTITSLNTASVASLTACSYVSGVRHSNWATSFDTSAVTAGGQALFITLPGEGLLMENGIYIDTLNINAVTVFYG